MIHQTITIWMRAIRIRFMLASLIAVASGISIAFWKHGVFNFTYAVLTFAGVICLHASVDLLNDYWDYKRGTDIIAKRTKFSGGTGVLPDNLLKPRMVYAAAVIFLILGVLTGTYFVIIRGIAIAIILGFAIVSIWFYSTSIVNSGLGELFVAIKGTLIVLGSFYVQTEVIDPSAIYVGAIIGILSASVLFANSFPDYDADRYTGRRTLLNMIGKQKGSRLFPILVMIPYILILAGIFLGYTKFLSLACMASIPFAIKAIKHIDQYKHIDKFVPVMAATVIYARITGLILALSLLL
ncbi:MAG TPA: prenyltransferase [Nitrososphaeraceae archaeon]|nr:prenyltransferase [Nitrososphaeraceae archaeon]